MKYDEFAFFNQQLAGMLRSGLPLEGALSQLVRSMRRGRIRDEFALLEKDLAQGIPLPEAVEKRKLPPLYIQVLKAGAESENLSSILTLLADYYGRLNALSLKLKGLMVYPFIVLFLSLGLSIFLTVAYFSLLEDAAELISAPRSEISPLIAVFLAPPMLMIGLLILAFFCFLNSRVRLWLRWKAPGFREASLARSSAALSLMLSSGTQLETALGLIEQVEKRTPAEKDFANWRSAIRGGAGKFDQIAAGSRAFPPLFIWLVAQGGENLARGFEKAAIIYEQRARHRTDMLLYAALPFAVILVGMVMLGQVYSVMALLVKMLSWLGL
jgi:type II secretory pathway component PulF